MNWIMLLLLYPVLPVMTGILANEAKPKKNIVIGVTLPFEARQTEEVRAICKQYRKRLWLLFGLLTAALLPSLLFSHDSVAFSWQMLWVLVVIVAPFFVYAAAHRQLRALKQARGWAPGERGEGVCGDESCGAAAAMDERLVVRAAGADGARAGRVAAVAARGCDVLGAAVGLPDRRAHCRRVLCQLPVSVPQQSRGRGRGGGRHARAHPRAAGTTGACSGPARRT